MSTITIPKKITNGKELIIISKLEWERLQKIARAKLSHLELEKGLKKALEDVKKGRTFGPFETVKEFKKAIKSRPL